MPELYGHKVHTKRMSTNIDAFQSVFENENLSKRDYRVFGFLCCRLETEHVRAIDIEQVSDSLNISKKEVKKSLNNLIRNGIISKGSDEHIKRGYRMTYNQMTRPFYDLDV